MLTELTIIEGIQNQSDDFRKQLVAPDREAQRALLAVPDPFGWLPLVVFSAKQMDDLVNLFE